MKMILKSLEDLNIFSENVISDLQVNTEATILGLYGDLGSGKTTLTQALARLLKVEDSVLSPTFVIMKIYELQNQKWKHLIHIDAYRIENSKELLSLGWQEIIKNKENLILIEWPERVSDIMPEHRKVFLKTLNEIERDVEFI